MPVELTWMQPDKILLAQWIGAVSDEDVRVLFEELRIIFDHSDMPVHLIIDLNDVTDLSPDAPYIFLQSALPAHSQRGRIGLVGSRLRAQVMADLVNRVLALEMMRLFKNRSLARDFLLQHDTPPPRLL